jgi:hypothetical protein
MSLDDELDLAIGPAVDIAIDRLNKWAVKCLEDPDYADGDEWATWRTIWRTMRAEYDDGRMRVRTHRYMRENLILPNGLPNSELLSGPKMTLDAVTEQYKLELIEGFMGRHPIPDGIKEGDMWLAPASEMQQMLSEREGEGAVYCVTAKADANGVLGPAYFWTNSPEMIAEAQAGHRRYMELLARETDGHHRGRKKR